MINTDVRLDYFSDLCVSHKQVLHTADILDGSEIVGQRNSFLLDIADELDASEIINLHFPCVLASMIDGRAYLKDDQPRMRYQNKLTFLNRFSVESDEDPSIPKSKKAAFDITYQVLMDFINKILADYEDQGGCGDFRFIDENSFRWEAIELTGSNMCGWILYFNDEEPAHFALDPTKWN